MAADAASASCATCASAAPQSSPRERSSSHTGQQTIAVQLSPPPPPVRPAEKIPISVPCGGSGGGSGSTTAAAGVSAPLPPPPPPGGMAASGPTLILGGDGGSLYGTSPPLQGSGIPYGYYPGASPSSSPPASCFYASPPIALSPPSMHMLTVAMGSPGAQQQQQQQQYGHIATSAPMHPGYGACSPPHPGGPLLFAPAYGVQMAVSPPTRTHIDPYGAASADLGDPSGGGGASEYPMQHIYVPAGGEGAAYLASADEGVAYYAPPPAAHGYVYGAADGGYYPTMGAQPQAYAMGAGGVPQQTHGYYTHAPPPPHGPPPAHAAWRISVNTAGTDGAGGHMGGYGGGTQGGGGSRPRNGSGSGRGNEPRRRSRSGSNAGGHGGGADGGVAATGGGLVTSNPTSPKTNRNGGDKRSPRSSTENPDADKVTGGAEQQPDLSFNEIFEG